MHLLETAEPQALCLFLPGPSVSTELLWCHLLWGARTSPGSLLPPAQVLCKAGCVTDSGHKSSPCARYTLGTSSHEEGLWGPASALKVFQPPARLRRTKPAQAPQCFPRWPVLGTSSSALFITQDSLVSTGQQAPVPLSLLLAAEVPWQPLNTAEC